MDHNQQSLLGAQGLLTAGYDPQKNALAMLQGSAVPAGYADIGRRTGTELGSQLDLGGIEGRLNAEQMANQLRLGQQSALLEGMVGSEMSTRDKLLAAALDQGTDGSGGLMEAIFKKFGLGG